MPTGTAQSHSSVAGDDPIILESDTQFKPGSSGFMEAEKLLTCNVSVEGTFFVEVMAGECIITLGVLLKRVPCLKPWDLVFGEAWDVLTRGKILMDLAEQ